MAIEGFINQRTVRYINDQISILSGIVLLTIGISLIFVFKFMYDMLEYLPIASLITLMAIVVWLTVAGMFIARRASRRAIENIREYAAKLNSLVSLQKDTRDIRHADIFLNRVLDCAKDISMSEFGALVGGLAQSSPDDGLMTKGAAGAAGKFSEFRCALKMPSGATDDMVMVLRRKDRDEYTPEEQELIGFIADFASKSLDYLHNMERMTAYEIHVTGLLVSAMECRVDKRGHSGRVANYALMLANRIGLPEERKTLLHRAALLHDIGYLKLPLEKLSPETYMKHSELGYEMLMPIDFYKGISRIVLHHHEMYDGSGYPGSLAGEDIPLESRIITIAEAFDAIVAGKTYGAYHRPGMDSGADKIQTITSALVEMDRQAGTHFDPSLTKEFIYIVEPEKVAELYY